MKPFSWLFNLVFGIVAFCILLFAVVAISFNAWFPVVAPWVMGNKSGFKLDIGKSQSNVFTVNLNLSDVSVRNGDQYLTPQFIDIERFRCDFLLSSLFTKKIIVEDFTLHIPQISCVKNADGAMNVTEFLGEILPKSSSSPKKSKEKQQNQGEYRQVLFRNFDIQLGRVTLMDYSSGGVKVTDIPLNYRYKVSDIDMGTLIKRLTADLKAQGASFLMQSVLDSLMEIPAKPLLKVQDKARRTLEKGIGEGENFFQSLKRKLK